MFLVLLLLLVVVPLAELWAIIAVSDAIGGWPTIALLLFDSLLGAWLLRRQGKGVMAKVDNRLRANELPTDELVDGVLILGASALMITPGFITDITGFLLLLPVTRIPLRSLLKRRFTAKMGQGFQFVSMGSPGGAGGFGFSGGFGRASTSTSARSSTPQGAGRIWDAEVVEPDAELSDPGVSDPGPGGQGPGRPTGCDSG
ncbi:FxsA family protein [Candidatus Neomicrothrix sp.]|jgi:UPF0716 protein FxsA|uniref:FxsA family protein n=1 Tax=Candidatus Neomicrothrix sp. TaxID=2719034 RepID=UPI001B448F46|nr:FxsA family protein [Candidatus Microthrix sp.]MBK7021788.1 FxsA family protein [Candidatus Microthrix sp.]MBP7876624.1 FxsA family protein [Candidatus Microthrix sp.]MBP9833242.1 FxsA family protein [Candidatus Microthrix sp.]